MLDALDTASLGKMDMGAMSAFSNRNTAQKAQDKAEAVKKGNLANQENLETKVRGVAEEFVSVFMNQVMKSMRATVPENQSMHGDNGEKFFQEMLDTEYASYMAKGSGYGLTDLIYESLMTNYRMQDAAAAASAQANAIPEAESIVLAPEAQEKEVAVQAIG